MCPNIPYYCTSSLKKKMRDINEGNQSNQVSQPVSTFGLVCRTDAVLASVPRSTDFDTTRYLRGAACETRPAPLVPYGRDYYCDSVISVKAGAVRHSLFYKKFRRRFYPNNKRGKIVSSRWDGFIKILQICTSPTINNRFIPKPLELIQPDQTTSDEPGPKDAVNSSNTLLIVKTRYLIVQTRYFKDTIHCKLLLKVHTINSTLPLNTINDLLIGV